MVQNFEIIIMLEKLGLKEKKENDFFGGLGGGEKKSGGIAASAASVLPTFSEEPACAKCCPKLSYKQRLYGFMGTACLGWLLSLIGTFVLIGGVSATNIRVFAVLYVLGNVSLIFLCVHMLFHACCCSSSAYLYCQMRVSTGYRFGCNRLSFGSQSPMCQDVASNETVHNSILLDYAYYCICSRCDQTECSLGAVLIICGNPCWYLVCGIIYPVWKEDDTCILKKDMLWSLL